MVAQCWHVPGAIVIQAALKKLLLFVSVCMSPGFFTKGLNEISNPLDPSNWACHEQLLTPRHLESILQSGNAIPEVYSFLDFTDAVIGTDLTMSTFLTGRTEFPQCLSKMNHQRKLCFPEF